MKHWRHTNPNRSTAHNLQHRVGIELSLQELLECKRLAENLQLPTQQKVKTHLLGGFISHFKGRGMDFDEARPYQMGDDIRSIDWRVTARTGEAHTKIYREERERPVFVILDQSAAMMFGSRQQFKSVQAAKIAALVMWKTLDDGNRFGALIYDEINHLEYKPSSSRKSCLRILNQIVENHNQQIINQYQKQQPVSDTQSNTLANTLYRARRIIRPGSLVYVLSDFTQLNDDAEHHLLRLSQHNDMHLVQISDPLEQELPPPGYYTVTNGKERMVLNTQDAKLRQRFHSAFIDCENHLKEICLKQRIRWSGIDTQQNLQQLLTSNSLTQS